MKNIVFATDLSIASKVAFEYAIQLSNDLGASLRLIHIYEKPAAHLYPNVEYTQADEDKMIAAANEELNNLYDEYLHKGFTMNRTTLEVVKNTSAFQGIIDTVTENETDLLILSSKGDNVGRELLFGGIVNRLVKECPTALMTIPKGTSYKKPKIFFFTTNYYQSDLPALQELAELIIPLQATIEIGHIDRLDKNELDYDASDFWEDAKQLIPHKNLQFRIMSSKDIYGRIQEYINTFKPDVLIMTHYENGLFHELFQTDLIQKMEKHSSIPILTFNQIGLSKIKNDDLSMEKGKR